MSAPEHVLLCDMTMAKGLVTGHRTLLDPNTCDVTWGRGAEGQRGRGAEGGGGQFFFSFGGICEFTVSLQTVEATQDTGSNQMPRSP